MECAKKRCATIARETLDDPRACEIIENELYVDDGATGGTIEEVDRLVGVKDPITGLYTGTLQQILSIGGFKIKEFMISGRRSDESKKLLGDGILGYQWESSVDIMAVRLKVNLSMSKKKVHRYPDFTLDDLPRLRNVKLTKRKLLMLIGSIYDPLSILSPFTVKLKISMGELTAVCPNQTWDSTIPDNFNQEWVNFMEEMIKCPTVHFSRRILPHGYIGKPNLAGYFDGSIFVYAAVVYVWVAWWNADEQLWDFSASLLTSKTRICPQFGLTAYKSELSGCTLLHRLLRNIVSYSPS